MPNPGTKVRQLDFNTGEVIGEFDTIVAASIATDTRAGCISEYLRGIRIQAGGYKWEKVK